MLAASSILALFCWMVGGGLWYYTERLVNAENFDSIPSAWYFGSIFLLSEWCFVDFSFGGKILCIVYCLVGVALFSIFTG